MPDARDLAFRLIPDLLAGTRPESRLRRTSDADLAPREDRLAAEIAYGVVRHLSRIDWMVAHYAGKPVQGIVPPALTAIRIGLYQMIFMPSIPRYAAVSVSVSLAKKFAPKAAGFVNWILRRIGPDVADLPQREVFRNEESWLAVFHSFPPWIVRRWVRRLGLDEAGRLLVALNIHPPPAVRVNLLHARLEEVTAALRLAGFETVPGRYSPAALGIRGSGRLTELPLFGDGKIYLQDESSQLAAIALAPRPGERILDACAGVGGKTTHLAALSEDAAGIVAADRDPARLARLAENARRLGLRGIRPCRGDLLDPSFLAAERFDAVLLDAPCSGLGTIPRHPELKWIKRPSDPRRLAATQRRLLERAAALLVPGGRIVYSTCTTEPEENEEIVRAFLTAHPAFRIQAPAGGAIAHIEELLTPEGCLRSWPHRHGIGGAFIARLQS